MEQKILIIGYSAYEFTDEKKGQIKTGGKVSYLTENPLNEDLKKGYLPVQAPVSFDFAKNLTVPCLANVKYIASTDSNNKLVMKIDSISVIKADINLNSLFQTK